MSKVKVSHQVLDRNLVKNIHQISRENWSKFVCIPAKQCKIHFNLTKFFVAVAEIDDKSECCVERKKVCCDRQPNFSFLPQCAGGGELSHFSYCSYGPQTQWPTTLENDKKKEKPES